MISEPATILLATDGGSASTGARAAAAHLARRSGARLHIVHALAPWTETGNGMPALAWATMQTERHFIEERLGCPVAGVHLPRGLRVPAILAAARTTSADLIAIGGRRLNLLRELLSYRVSRGVVSAANRPVLRVPGDERQWPPERVVVGCDGSDEARRAAEMAAWIARLSDAEVIVACAVGRGGAVDDAHARHDAQTCVADMIARHVPLVSTRVVGSEPVAEFLRDLSETSGGRTLLALGARGSGPLARRDRPSVSKALLDDVRQPMLLVPPAVLGRVRVGHSAAGAITV